MAPAERTTEDVLALLPPPLYADPDARAFVSGAWTFAARAHRGQLRRSGEPHTEHLFQTARTLGELGMGAETIAAGLLHDTIEDTETTGADLESAFGPDVAMLVDGVTKLERERRAYRLYQAENLRHLLYAAAKDARVLLIKLADRLHNMRTLQYLPEKKRGLIARETLEIFVPAADRLGMNVLKRELEDLSFEHADPHAYEENERLFAARLAERELALTGAAAALLVHLSFAAPFGVRVERRVKGKMSFRNKLARKGGDLASINDIITLQAIVPNADDCYKTLGYTHALWRPVPAKMKDYIAFPKPNGYQCLRTVVDGGPFGTIEIHIYSNEMHDRAQRGYAAEIAYRSLGRPLFFPASALYS